MRGMLCWIGLFVLATPAEAQHGSSTTVNPNVTPEDAAMGAAIYRGRCAGCHGPDGGGTGTGPALNSGTFRRGASDEALFQTISAGVPGTSMPAFPNRSLETWQVITHLRSLSVARRSATIRGNAAAGASVFRANCAGCHAMGREGGLTGPDLSEVAMRRSEAELRQSVLRPDDLVASAYWSVAAKSSSGQVTRGIRLNEDTHSVQIRDERGRLQSLAKKDMASMELIRRSPMPSFEGKLSAKDLDDVLAYLTGGGR